MKNDTDFLREGIRATLYFDRFKCCNNTEYMFLLEDLLNAKMKAVNFNGSYLEFKALSLCEDKMSGIFFRHNYLLYLPYLTFKRFYPISKPLDDKYVWQMLVKFKRLSKKKIMFTDYKYWKEQERPSDWYNL